MQVLATRSQPGSQEVGGGGHLQHLLQAHLFSNEENIEKTKEEINYTHTQINFRQNIYSLASVEFRKSIVVQ